MSNVLVDAKLVNGGYTFVIKEYDILHEMKTGMRGSFFNRST